MASGPEHYRKAEQLMNAPYGRSREEDTSEEASITAEAQVHALLALAAATALGDDHTERREWYTVARTDS